MRLLVATGNAGKLAEFAEVLGPLGFEVEGPPPGFEVMEDGATFVANALKKAQALVALRGEAAVADDSGLEVEALGGAPGVLSARYAGSRGSAQDADNRRALLQALAAVDAAERAARFVCVIAYCAPAQAPLLFHGVVRGHIAAAESGSGGFGYDAVFVPSGESATFAALGSARKHAISHRGQALRALAAHLQRRE